MSESSQEEQAETDLPMSFGNVDGDDAALDLSADAQQPEEASPYDPTSEERPMVYVRIVDADFQPRAGLEYEVSGDALAETHRGVTDESGELQLEDCGAGVFTVTAGGKSIQVHTLTVRDLDASPEAYRVVL